MDRKIKKVDATLGHGRQLQAFGYPVVETPTHFVVQATGVVTGVVDVSTPEAAQAALKDLIVRKAVWSYKTKFRFADKTRGWFTARNLLGRILKIKGEALRMDAWITDGSDGVEADDLASLLS